MMAALAQYRDDVSGAITLAGTATAYTATTNEVLAVTPATGQLLAFVPNLTNGIAPTLACDGGTAYPIQSAVGNALGAASLVAGSPYTATFNGSAWVLRNFYGNPFNIPLGGMMPYLGATAPNSNFALPFGQAISRTTYATLFAMISTTFGVGDGTTTFNIPDLRDRAIFGLGNMGGSDKGLITVAGGNFDGTVLGNTGGGQNQTLTIPQLPTITPAGIIGGTQTLVAINNENTSVFQKPSSTPGGGGAVNNLTINGSSFTFTGTSFGSGNSHPIMPPSIMLPMILRII